jgi:molecular chaperone GrpE
MNTPEPTPAAAPTAAEPTPVTAPEQAPEAAPAETPHAKGKKGHAKDKERLAELEAQVTELTQKCAELQDKYLRSLADFDNFRKRSQRDQADARQLGKLLTLEEMLPVLDHFQMAMTAAGQNTDLATLKFGMDMILAEFQRAFESLGVAEIVTAAGTRFDPTQHEAVTTEASATVAEGLIVRPWKRGYRMGERVLRPAGVVVSTGAPPAASTEAKS